MKHVSVFDSYINTKINGGHLGNPTIIMWHKSLLYVAYFHIIMPQYASFLFELVLLILNTRRLNKTLKEGKHYSDDGIPLEVLKRCDIDEIILDGWNQALINDRKPEQWSILNLTPVQKVGPLISNTTKRHQFKLHSHGCKNLQPYVA